MYSGAVIIPARYQSSRFPGKPLAIINNKTMIWHVYNKCIQAIPKERVYVATDSPEIRSEVESFGGNVIMTSKNCMTGTDRLSEANNELDYDFVINVQGDEPMIEPKYIQKIFKIMEKDVSSILNCYCDIHEDEILSQNVPKMLISKNGRLIYTSRGGVPFDKNMDSHSKYKQVCIYGFGKDHLKLFSSQTQKGEIEKYEDLEILRFLELDVPVHMIKVDPYGIAVDTPSDLDLVKSLMK